MLTDWLTYDSLAAKTGLKTNTNTLAGEKYLLPEENQETHWCNNFFVLFQDFHAAKGNRVSSSAQRSRRKISPRAPEEQRHSKCVRVSRGVALSQQPNIIVYCVAYTTIQIQWYVYAPRRYKETLTTGFRSVAGKLSGLAVGEGLRTAKRRRAATGVAQEARACARGGVAARPDAPTPARCAQRPTTSLAFFSQSGQTSTLSDSSAITMPHVIISWPPLLNQLKAGGNKALFLHRCKIMKKVRMRLAINSQDRKQHIFCVRDVLKTTLLWSSFNTSQISFHPFETWKL